MGTSPLLAVESPRRTGEKHDPRRSLLGMSGHLVAEEVEKLAERVALVKKRFARQKVGVKLEHLSRLAQVHTRCATSNRCVEQFEEAHDFQLEQTHAAVEVAWNESMDAVDMLLQVLP